MRSRSFLCRRDRRLEVCLSIFKKLFSVPTSTQQDFYPFSVRCTRCGEIIEGRVNLSNDLSPDYDGGRTVYFGRKVLIGSGHCFQQIEVELKFSPARKLIERTASGGAFVDD
jgi:hypothetical protein